MEPQALTLQVASDPAVLARLRGDLRAWLEAAEIGESDVGAVVAACSEIVADAIEDVPSPSPRAIEVTAGLTESEVVVRCSAAPDWLIADHPSRYVAALLVDHVSIEHAAEATTVELRKAFGRGLRTLRF